MQKKLGRLHMDDMEVVRGCGPNPRLAILTAEVQLPYSLDERAKYEVLVRGEPYVIKTQGLFPAHPWWGVSILYKLNDVKKSQMPPKACSQSDGASLSDRFQIL